MVRTVFGGQQKQLIYGSRRRDQRSSNGNSSTRPSGFVIEELFAIEADCGQQTVVGGQFNQVGITSLTCDREHTPVPEDQAGYSTGFIVSGNVG